MLIHIRTLQGKQIALEVEPNDKILAVKKKIQVAEGIRADIQRLVFQEESLQNKRTVSSYGIGGQSTIYLVMKSGNIVAGGYGAGNSTKELCFPYGIAVDEDHTVYTADWGNHRIIQWPKDSTDGRMIAGGLKCPTDVLIDKESRCLIIADRGNKRVVRWSLDDDTTNGEILLENIGCWGLAMDRERNLYVSDMEKNDVRQYVMGQTNGTVVAGGNGRGFGLHQLDGPTYIFVDQNQTVYVSDTWNHRVMKWEKNATKGTVVAKGFPRGIFVDDLGQIYVADYGSHRLMRWSNDGNNVTIIDTNSSEEDDEAHIYHPWCLTYHQDNHLYVSDHLNHKVKRILLKQPE